jgi:hypothetical protein
MPRVTDALLTAVFGLLLVISAALLLAAVLGLWGRLQMAWWRRRWRRGTGL